MEVRRSSLSLEDAPFEEFGPKLSNKEGGMHKSDPESGIYQKNGDTFLIKRDKDNLVNDISEYLASRIFRISSKGSGCEITLVKSRRTGNTFLASKYFKDGYRDLWKDFGHKKRREKTETLLVNINKILKKFGFQEILTDMQKALLEKTEDGEYRYINYEKIIVSSLLVDDYSVHSGNIGVINVKQKEKLVRVDFGAAFRRFDMHIHPLVHIKNRVGLEKNHFLRDHPVERRITIEFSKELKRVSNIDLKVTIINAMKIIFQFYDFKHIFKFSIRTVQNFYQKYFVCAQTTKPVIDEIKAFLMFDCCVELMKKSDDVEKFEKLMNMSENKNMKTLITKFVINQMKRRQNSLKNLATEIDIKLAESSDNVESKLDSIVCENPLYCEVLIKYFETVNGKHKSPELQIEYLPDTIIQLQNTFDAVKVKQKYNFVK